ncbi:MAG: ABC transporter ATP-binding protein [Proteobacteria bacterium]|nr:ABC transporter ATP-binding protein [Pseudomonadota bacterium]MDA0983772.1 ABC transporter ATP-binding protein [Pseudomonadota bacterium]
MNPTAASSAALLDVRGLQVEFDTHDGRVRVIESLSFALDPGETLCVVGESGCGKSMTALAVMGLVPQPTGYITAGEIVFQGEDLVRAGGARMQKVRGNEISMIFQEPMTSLNPVYTAGEQIAEALRLHMGLGNEAARKKAIEMLRAVHIPEPEKRVDEFPHQFSGGMRQRVMIAIALACEPKVLIADEPTTALDVTVQAQIFDLLQELREARGTAIILITHDMGAVAEMADRVIVMYAGRKVEEGRVEDILARPAHPYTQGLLACRPRLVLGEVGERAQLAEIPGVVPPLHLLGAGCPFAPRCPHAKPVCSERPPAETQVGERHSATCWLLEQPAVAVPA